MAALVEGLTLLEGPHRLAAPELSCQKRPRRRQKRPKRDLEEADAAKMSATLCCRVLMPKETDKMPKETYERWLV